MESDVHKTIKIIADSVSRQPLGLAHHLPETWAKPRLCFQNADRMARQHGGRVQYGWTFHYRIASHNESLGFIFLTHHAVWNRPDGHLVDVTLFHPDPLHHPITDNGSVLFLVDDTAIPIMTSQIFAPLPLRYFPIGSSPEILKYVEARNKEEIKKYKGIPGFAP